MALPVYLVTLAGYSVVQPDGIECCLDVLPHLRFVRLLYQAFVFLLDVAYLCSVCFLGAILIGRFGWLLGWSLTRAHCLLEGNTQQSCLIYRVSHLIQAKYSSAALLVYFLVWGGRFRISSNAGGIGARFSVGLI